ncbi:NAD(P)/FAD-dependent oxidoreductase [Myxococcaceae bacterium GXIMD 01537]
MEDVVIVGGGPAGLSAALILGRGCKRVLLCDAGPPRNAAADRVRGFVTRDGIPPAEFRRVGREQLAAYPDVRVLDARVQSITPQAGGFRVEVAGEVHEVRRVLLTGGVVDVLPELPGLRESWGRGVFQCPYCHGWELRDRAWGLLAPSPELLEWGLFLLGWSRDLVIFTGGAFPVSKEARRRLAGAGVRLEERPLRALRSSADGHLAAVVLEDGSEVARDVLFARPPQRQTDLVRGLGLAVDEQGFVRVNERRETSLPGVHAAGDLTTHLQGALIAAAAGAFAAYAMNHALNMERVERELAR